MYLPAGTVEQLSGIVKPDDEREDEELIAACQSAMPAASSSFEILVRRYEPRVYRTCLRMLGKPAEAEDVAQEVFIKVFRKLHAFERRSSFSTWLFTVTRNECLSAIAKSRATERMLQHDVDLSELPGIDDSVAIAVESADLLSKVLVRMTLEEQEVLIARFVSELAIADIAELLGLSLSAAKMRLYRAIERFESISQSISDTPSSSQ